MKNQNAKKFSGVYTALVTPFSNGKVDFKSLERLVDQQMSAKISGFIVNGTTGESPTLETKEVEDVFKLVRQKTSGQFQVILGVGTNATSSTVEWVKRASDWKADGALAVVPYYNKPPQRGLEAHFKSVAQNSDVPVILYNVPGRTVAGLEIATITSLSKVEKIVGIKESTGDLAFAQKIRKEVGEDFSLLSGDDGTCVEFTLNGGDGVISVCSHVIPKELKECIDLALAKDKSCLEKYKAFNDLMVQLYVEANPIPVKKAMQMMNVISSAEMRMPLVSLDEKYFGAMGECLKKINKV